MAWEEYKHDKAPLPEEMEKDKQPETILRDARKRLDVVGMLVDRREVAAFLEAGVIRCVNLFSDASPVTGTELQGMVANLCFFDGSSRTYVLPGASLGYGKYDAANKSIALLHALWLSFGTDKATLRKFLDLVVSITTDFGVEMHTLEMPDILDAFYKWMSGTPLQEVRLLINYDRRLFPRCIRIVGWSHGLGNLMKEVAKSVHSWPVLLDCYRDLCRFFKITTWL